MSHYDFFQNQECEYFPCHAGADPESFNCLFCYCPLYALGDKCGGSFQYLPNILYDIFPNNTDIQPRFVLLQFHYILRI